MSEIRISGDSQRPEKGHFQARRYTLGARNVHWIPSSEELYYTFIACTHTHKHTHYAEPHLTTHLSSSNQITPHLSLFTFTIISSDYVWPFFAFLTTDSPFSLLPWDLSHFPLAREQTLFHILIILCVKLSQPYYTYCNCVFRASILQWREETPYGSFNVIPYNNYRVLHK